MSAVSLASLLNENVLFDPTKKKTQQNRVLIILAKIISSNFHHKNLLSQTNKSSRSQQQIKITSSDSKTCSACKTTKHTFYWRCQKFKCQRRVKNSAYSFWEITHNKTTAGSSFPLTLRQSHKDTLFNNRPFRTPKLKTATSQECPQIWFFLTVYMQNFFQD